MSELEELRLAYAESSRQKNELLTAHKLSAADNAELRAELAAARQASGWEEDLCTQALERVNVLEDALQQYVNHDLLTGVRGKLFDKARAALEATK